MKTPLLYSVYQNGFLVSANLSRADVVAIHGTTPATVECVAIAQTHAIKAAQRWTAFDPRIGENFSVREVRDFQRSLERRDEREMDRILNTPEARAAELRAIPGEMDLAGPDA